MNKYSKLGYEALREHYNNFMFNNWSFSKLNSFSRNEKAFEMSYIYRVRSKMSASAISGQAYHECLDTYFSNKKENKTSDIIELEIIAKEFIYSRYANNWKLQKTTPTIEDCQIKSLKTCMALLTNFFAEISVYEDEIKEVLYVEQKFSEWIDMNGVEIPIPCTLVVDLVIETFDGKIVIIDHKSKAKHADEKELVFTSGKQAITYTKGFEEFSGITVDEFWIIENKYSQNRDKSKQLNKYKIVLDNDSRRLYEAMIYEPLKRMIEAIQDPDYVYLINQSDNFVDQAELHEFWAFTLIAEVEDFNIPEEKQDLIRRRQKKIRDAGLASVNPKIIKEFQRNAATFIQYDLTNKDMTKTEKIEHILSRYGIITNIPHSFIGYSSDTFLLEVSAGTKISNIHKYKLDIASALDVSNVRIQKDLFVYEDKSYVAIEVSKKRDKDLMFDPSKLEGMKIPIGIDNFDQTIIWDLENQSTPHMLICGATGSGKTVSIMSTIAYAKLAGVEEIIIFDPKFEFTNYNAHVVSDIEDIENTMQKLVEEMNRRVKNGINSKTLIVFDEFADAVANSKKGNDLKVYEDVCVGNYKDGGPKMKREHSSTLKSLEENLKILLQKGRSSGFRIIAATQRASVKVITGDAKVNFPVQICFRVPKEVDSKVVIDEGGAETLSGRGDGLIKSPEYLNVKRFQAFYKK